MDVREKLEVIAHLGDHISYKEDIGICYDSDLAKVIEDAYLMLKNQNANGVTVQEWISVNDRLPEPEQEVLVQRETRPSSFKYQCKAFYVPQKWLRDESAFNWDYECCNEYDEDADDYYVNEGWYERVHNWDDYNAVGIGDFVTHWMPMPQPPKGE